MNKTSAFSPEIQGLRAIAVLAVLLFHIWPPALPGGYVGVDVFFVISGYLITGLLLREAEGTGRISIGRFYARRIKRLLPAATIVLLAVTTCISILPVVRWEGTAFESIASALYFENWWLAKNAVDYLASENAPSALQHYWSLSVEEQYYLVWPVLLALSAWLLPAFRNRPRYVFGALVAIIGCLSLAYSIYITPRDPGLAYFATTVRGWELAIGGALAVWTSWRRIPGGVRLFAGYAGILAIALATWKFNTGTSFPGYLAMLPTLGAALVIVSGESSSRLAIYGALKSRLFQYLGDLSYSLYLWHWPVVVFYTVLAGRQLGLVDGLIVLGVSTALAHQTKYLIEDRFRSSEFAASRPWMPFAFGALCILSSVVFAGAVLHQVERRSGRMGVPESAAGSDHPGALALTSQARFDSGVPYIPTALAAVDDKGRAYQDGCITSLLQSDVRQCRYGVKTSSKHIIVVGDSHAVHWLPALAIIAERRGWMLIAITKSSCPFAILNVPREKASDRKLQSCLSWERQALKQVIGYRPQVVIFAQSVSSASEESVQTIATGVVAAWQELEANGSTVIAIRDTPRFKSSRPDCMSVSRATAESCSRMRTDAMPPVDPLVLASEKHPSAFLVDMTDAICDHKFCKPVVGNIFVWRDAHHLTATYARSLVTPLDRAIGPILEAAGKTH